MSFGAAKDESFLCENRIFHKVFSLKVSRYTVAAKIVWFDSDYWKTNCLVMMMKMMKITSSDVLSQL